MKAFAYIRVSGAAQIDGDGPERQREKIMRFCDQQKLPVEQEFFEEGVSGTVEGLDRPAFVSMIEAIEDQQKRLVYYEAETGFCIVVERMDRLARDLMVQEILLAECKKRHIQVFCSDQGQAIDMADDGGDPTRKLIRQLLGAVAEWEKNVIVMKLKAAKDRMRRETGRCEGPRPYGSTAEEQKTLALVLELKHVGLSFSKIAAGLNSRGHLTRTGKQWNKARVAHIFQSTKDK